MPTTLRAVTGALVAALVTAGALLAAPAAANAAAPNCAETTAAPSLAVQNACGDHVMGATTAPPAVATAPQPSASSAPQFHVDYSAAPSSSYVKGVDVSGWQGSSTNWANLASHGYRFAFMKATESTSYVSSYFQSQWTAAGANGLIRGAYHFAEPHDSSGAAQAQYFYSHGAYLSSGTNTLPPVLDIETGTDGECSGLSQAGMVQWIASFASTLKSLTGRTPLVYSNPTWWQDCTNNSTSLASDAELWIADWTTGRTSPYVFPGFGNWSFWQYSDNLAGSGLSAAGGDIDAFNGTTLTALREEAAVYPRIAGADRYGTSAAASKAFPAGVGTVFVATGADYPDALAGGAAAGKVGAPVELISPTGIPSAVAAELTRLNPAKIVVLGGPQAVSTTVYNSLASYTQSKAASSVTRESGVDRYDTSASVATSTFGSGVANAYIATGADFPDAITGSALAASKAASGPMLLVESNTIPAAVVAALQSLKPQKITVFGGPTVISDAVLAELKAYTTTGSVTRLGGSDRYQTAQLIAGKFAAGSPYAYVASGADFPDALVGAALAARTSSAIVLVAPASVPAATNAALARLSATTVEVLGGTAAVTPAALTQLVP